MLCTHRQLFLYIRVPNEELFKSTLHTQNVNDTFMPALMKMFNKYSQQATDVMMSCNRLLDRFYYMIFRSFDPRGKESDTVGNNRFCRLTIWTSGNHQDNVDGFSNNIHVDNDFFQQVFQESALWLLSQLEDENLFAAHDDIQYLRTLLELGNGRFQSLTVCGYDIVSAVKDNNNQAMMNIDEWQTFAFFALLGLGVSVKVSHCYHSFMAGIVSHCTPTPISIACDIVSTFTGDVNIVGWGGGGNEERRTFYEDHGGHPVPIVSQRFFESWLRTVPANIQRLARRDGLV